MTTGRYILNCIVEQVPQLSPADALEIANELLNFVVWCDEEEPPATGNFWLDAAATEAIAK